MRFRLWLLAATAALGLAMLTVPAGRSGTATGPGGVEAAAAVAVSPAVSPVNVLHRSRADIRVPVQWAPGVASLTAGDASRRPSASRADTPHRAVLLDGSDRWRSLLLGAPPLLG